MTNLFKKILIIVVICTALVFVGVSAANAATFTFEAKNQNGTPNRHALLCKGLGCVGTENYDERLTNGSIALELNPGDVIEVWHEYNYQKNPTFGVNTNEGETWYRFVVDKDISTYTATFRNKYLPKGNEVEIDPTELEFMNLLNAHRQSIGLQSLSLAKSLTFITDSHVTNILNTGNYSHTGMYGWDDAPRAIDYGINVHTEDVVGAGHTAQEALTSYLSSSSHKEALEKQGATHIGVGRMHQYWVVTVSVGCDIDCGAPEFISTSKYNQDVVDAPPPPCGEACNPPTCTSCNVPKENPKNKPITKTIGGNKKNSSEKKDCKAGIKKASLVKISRTRVKLSVQTTKCTSKKAKLGVRISGSKKASYFNIKPGKTRSYTMRTHVRGTVKTTIWLKNGKKDFAKRNVSVKASKSKSSKNR